VQSDAPKVKNHRLADTGKAAGDRNDFAGFIGINWESNWLLYVPY